MQEQLDQENRIISQALSILGKRIKKDRQMFSSPATVKSFLALKLGQKEHEVFGVMWLDVKNKLISCDELFTGSIAHCPVYPREVIKKGLQCNAKSAIFFHNHPSGEPSPSAADIALTKELYNSLKLVDINVLDHIIVAGDSTSAFTEYTYMSDIASGLL